MNELSENFYKKLNQLAIQYNRSIEHIAGVIGIHPADIKLARLKYGDFKSENNVNISHNNILGRLHLFYEFLKCDLNKAHEF